MTFFFPFPIFFFGGKFEAISDWGVSSEESRCLEREKSKEGAEPPLTEIFIRSNTKVGRPIERKRRMNVVHFRGVERCRPAGRSVGVVVVVVLGFIPSRRISMAQQSGMTFKSLGCCCRRRSLFIPQGYLCCQKAAPALLLRLLLPLFLRLGRRGFINCERASINNHSLSLSLVSSRRLR